MSNLNVDAVNLRSLLAALKALLKDWSRLRGGTMLPAVPFEGDGVTDTFTLPAGQKPYIVAIGSNFAFKGAAYDYTMSRDVFGAWKVKFSVAPSNAALIVVHPIAE